MQWGILNKRMMLLNLHSGRKKRLVLQTKKNWRKYYRIKWQADDSIEESYWGHHFYIFVWRWDLSATVHEFLYRRITLDAPLKIQQFDNNGSKKLFSDIFKQFRSNLHRSSNIR